MPNDERMQLFSKPIHEVIHLMRIVQIVAERQRSLEPTQGVLPVTVQAWLNRYRAEQTLRRDMTMLWRAGYLVRVGDKEGTRRGYRVAAELRTANTSTRLVK